MKALACTLVLSLGASFETHVAFLASDALEGRGPGSAGGDRAAEYIREQLESAGVATRIQRVPLIGRTRLAHEDSIVALPAGRERALPETAFILGSELTSPTVTLTAGLARWDEDVAGKLVVVERDGDVERARARKAIGTVSFVEELPKHGFEDLLADWGPESSLAVRAWIDAKAFDDVDAAELRIRHRARVRRFTSPNVIGIVPGSLADAGAVVVTAHYDAYGIGPPDASGDRIYNGAIDNAMGVAALIELARHFAADEHQTERTLVFVATTAEERGTLGARYYADHPVVELDETTVVINLDGVNALAPTDDFIVFPSVGTETGAALALIGERADMRLTSEPWQVGMHFAFDTAPFLRRGLVGLTLWQGSAYRGVSKEELEDHLRRVRAMHTPADEWHDPANLGAVEQHLALYVAAVEHFADASTPRPVLSRHHPFGDAAPP